ncbi:MAG: hypothetical protein IPH96_07970 [Saprospiraceae bacterium]|jgi:hypothetical protein|nr:hypothetical protein [Saprospiraceae bacterium]MBK8735902.1 hypothetical protein [Saprospiraceae bacterium]
MQQLILRGFNILFLISFIIFSCQNESDKSDFTTNDKKLDKTQFNEFFEKINSQFNKSNVLSSRGIILPPVSSACQPSTPPSNLQCATAHIIRTVNLTPNPTCPVCSTATVGFTVRVCFDPSLAAPNYSFTFWNFGLAGISLDCETCIYNLPGHGGDVVLDQMSDEASFIVESEYVSPWVDTWHPPCSNNSYFSSDFLRQTCYRWCIDLTNFEFSQITCGTKCCQRTRTFCWEPLPLPNGKVRISPPVFQTIGTSTCGTIPTILCNGLELPCEDRPCGQIP